MPMRSINNQYRRKEKSEMLNRESFCQIMQALNKMDKIISEQIDKDMLPVENPYDATIGSILEALGKECESYFAEEDVKKFGYDIERFAYEHDWGKDYHNNGYLVSDEGVEYRPKTFDKLYDMYEHFNDKKNDDN